MRFGILAAATGAVLGLAMPAFAGSGPTVRTQTYSISGETGQALLLAMDRKGPKHGFMARAIAQTSYTVNWDIRVRQADGVCRLQQVNGNLNLIYNYPAVTSPLAPALQKRWNRFFAGVRAHEQTHGRIAREMVRVAEKSASGLRVANDGQCDKTRREARRRIEAVYAQYEAKQIAFDKSEHRDGGNVQRLVDALVGKR